MNSDRLEALRRAVAPVAEAQPGLQGLYLFGSYLTDEEYEDSDVDIGALFEYGRDTKIQEIVRLQDRLEEALGRKVDLIDAGHCNAFLALDIIRGERIYEGDGLAMDLFDLYVMRRAGDLAPFERERRRMLLEESVSPGESRSAESGQQTPESPAESIAGGAERGWIRPPTNRLKTTPPRQPVAPMAEILAELEQDREDR